MIFDEKFLAALVLNPSLALKVEHKFGDAFIMPAYNAETSGESQEVVNENIANLIAYLKEIGHKFEAKQDLDIKTEIEAKYANLENSPEKTIEENEELLKDPELKELAQMEI